MDELTEQLIIAEKLRELECKMLALEHRVNQLMVRVTKR